MMNLLNATKLRVNGNYLTVPAGQAETVLRHLGVGLNSVNIQFDEIGGEVTATVVPRESGTKGCVNCEDCDCVENGDEERQRTNENGTGELDRDLILAQKPASFIMVEGILFPWNFTLVECKVMIEGGFTGLNQEDFANHTVLDWANLLDHYKYAKLAALMGPNHTPETVKAIVIEISSLLK